MHQQESIENDHAAPVEQAEPVGAAVEPGLKTSRIEALSDGIFAIAMTLLVLDISAVCASS